MEINEIKRMDAPTRPGKVKRETVEEMHDSFVSSHVSLDNVMFKPLKLGNLKNHEKMLGFNFVSGSTPAGTPGAFNMKIEGCPAKKIRNVLQVGQERVRLADDMETQSNRLVA